MNDRVWIVESSLFSMCDLFSDRKQCCHVAMLCRHGPLGSCPCLGVGDIFRSNDSIGSSVLAIFSEAWVSAASVLGSLFCSQGRLRTMFDNCMTSPCVVSSARDNPWLANSTKADGILEDWQARKHKPDSRGSSRRTVRRNSSVCYEAHMLHGSNVPGPAIHSEPSFVKPCSSARPLAEHATVTSCPDHPMQVSSGIYGKSPCAI